MKNNSKYQILTPTGFQSFSGIKKTNKEKYLEIILSNGLNIKCSHEHIFPMNDKLIFAKDLKVGNTLHSKKGNQKIIDIICHNNFAHLYDVLNVGDNNLFYANDIITHNCDASFLTSGATVIDPEILTYYEQFITPPVEKRGLGSSYWVWELPDYTKVYMVIADTARGDGSDYSTFIVFDVEACKVVAEFKDQLDTRDFGNLLVPVAYEWNTALLVIENTGMGWDVVQTAVQKSYPNLYYSPRSSEANASVDLYLKKYGRDEGMVPGFTNSNFTRPLVISKLVTLLNDKTCMFTSKRIMDELRTFIWKNGKAQAQNGSHDDLIMPLATGLFLRDTAMVFKQAGDDLTKAALNNFRKSDEIPMLYNPGEPLEGNPWMTKNIWGQDEDLTWLLK